MKRKDGLAYVTYRAGGKKHFEYFGPFGSERARAGYHDFCKRWLASHAPDRAQVNPTPGCRIIQLVEAHLAHAEGYYVRPDGSQTTEVKEFARTYATLVNLVGRLNVNEFRPAHFKAIRQQMIDSGISLGVINQRMGRIRRLFWWAVAEDLVEPAIAQALAAVRDLASGRGQAHEPEPVRAVSWEAVQATLPFLASEQLRAIVLFQWWAGTRPGEACQVRLENIFQAGSIPIGKHQVQLREGTWAYLVRAKMAHARQSAYQVYALGPQAREILKPWLRTKSGRIDCVPISSYLWISRPGCCYQTTSYAHAVAAACKRAGVPHWHPNQIRHAAEQRVEKLYGLEGGRKILGHASVNTTLTYSQRDLDGAAEIAEKIG